MVDRPGLFARLGGPAQVTVVSAPPGSGKTVLLRSWIERAAVAGHAGWVTAGRDVRDPQRFWPAVPAALRRTAEGPDLVRPLTAAPDLDGWAVVERLLKDLAPLRDRLWLVIDDVHELSPETLRQLELLIMRAPPELRFVLATRHDLRLGLHRLRLEGELTELREADLRFSLSEARQLFDAAGVELPGQALVTLQQRTEGWAAGLRLAALGLNGHPDPARFAAEFSGSERTVAEYLLAEVLDRQSERVRRLLLRTSVLERVNGELADLLTGEAGGERVLQDLVEANAFVVSLDAPRSWFRYHQLFAGLLQLELRRTAPTEVGGLHRSAARWLAGHGFAVEAIRQAQAARDWEFAARLLADHWPGLHLDGQDATTHDLLAGFPDDVRAADPELATLSAAAELAQGALRTAEQYLERADRESASVPGPRYEQAQLLQGITRLMLARRRGDLPTVAAEAERLRVLADAATSAPPTLGRDLNALALINLGITEHWTARFADAVRHLHQGRTLAHRIGRPYLELSGLSHLAAANVFQSFTTSAEQSSRAIELSRTHGWTDKHAAGIASMARASVLVWQSRLAEAGPWIERAERILVEDEASALAIHYVRGMFELGHGRLARALTAFGAAWQSAGTLDAPNPLVTALRTFTVQALVGSGDTDAAERTVAGFDDAERRRGEAHLATTMLRLAQGDPRAAAAALGPVVDGSAPLIWPAWPAQAFLLEAVIQDTLGDPAAAGRALERALDVAEPDGMLLWFVLHPAPDLLERHARHSAHAALIADIRNLLAATAPASAPTGPPQPTEPLSDSELRVLRYLPTNLTTPEIARELSVSRNTVKTHLRKVYAKLGTHRRADAVARARALGLLAPVTRSGREPRGRPRQS